MDKKQYKKSPVAHLVKCVLITIAAGFPVVILVLLADRIGYWWIVSLALYFMLIGAIVIAVNHARQMESLRCTMGDEAFFASFPRELRKQQRRNRGGKSDKLNFR